MDSTTIEATTIEGTASDTPASDPGHRRLVRALIVACVLAGGWLVAADGLDLLGLGAAPTAVVAAPGAVVPAG
jgi:hypothetical protein